jgi:hypothetical protein
MRSDTFKVSIVLLSIIALAESAGASSHELAQPTPSRSFSDPKFNLSSDTILAQRQVRSNSVCNAACKPECGMDSNGAVRGGINALIRANSCFKSCFSRCVHGQADYLFH